MTDVLCLCCGERYQLGDDCTNTGDGEHDAERAVTVARYLLDSGLEEPTRENVRDALAEIEVRR